MFELWVEARDYEVSLGGSHCLVKTKTHASLKQAEKSY